MFADLGNVYFDFGFFFFLSYVEVIMYAVIWVG